MVEEIKMKNKKYDIFIKQTCGRFNFQFLIDKKIPSTIFYLFLRIEI
jgi:hypothetical protein